ncbi:glutamate receptor 2-like isoform X1 [Haliotis asinina]|uniref:glutamate receptor 2-like isoform X1 n=1 Tax=Haliotis asinina TaxID=109174 RepID=UPI003531E271
MRCVGLDTVCAIVLLCLEVSWAFQRFIPIGAIFDKNDLISKRAFDYAVDQHAENEDREQYFQFNVSVELIDIADNFQLASAMCKQMSDGVFAILGQKEMTSTDIVKSFSKTFHMPFITPSLSRIAVSEESIFELHMRPDYTYALTDVIQYLNWRQVHFLYDSDEGLLRLQQIFWSLRDQHFVEGFAVQRLQDVRDVHDELRHLDRSYAGSYKNIVLDLSSEEAYDQVLRQIPEVGMNKYGYNYLLGSLDFKNLNLTRYRHGGVNVTGFQLLDEKNEISRGFLEALGMTPGRFSAAKDYQSVPVRAALLVDAVYLLGQAIYSMMQNDSEVFRYNFRRGDLYTYNDTKGIPCDKNPPVPWMHGEEILHRIKQMQPVGLSGVLSFDRKGFRQDYSLGVYSVSLDNGPSKIGTWYSSERGFESEEHDQLHLPDIQYIDRGVNSTKIITSILVDPFLMWAKEDAGRPKLGNDRFQGYAADLSYAMSVKVGFDYAIKLVADGAYGLKDNNTNTWNGMIGELTRNEADMAIAPLTITADRERFVDFSKPFMNFGISIMIKKPDKQKPGVFSFMQPLRLEIWVCITVAYIGVSVGLFLVSRFSPLEWKKGPDATTEELANEFSLFNSFWFSMGALMFQGSDSCPRSVSGRIIGGVWWFFVLIIISSYTANLAAFLTIERMFTPIESADDLAKQTTIKYGTIDSGTSLLFFKNSEVPTYKQMWNFMSANPDVFVKSASEGVAKVRDSKGKYAFLLESCFNEYENNRKPCDTMKVGPKLNSKGFGIATPRGSELRDKITLGVLTLREDGTLHTLQNKWWFEKGQCGIDGGSKDSGKRSLSLSNVAGVFYILVGGLVFAIILGVFEFMCFRAKNPKAACTPSQATYLRGTETATTLCTPNDREDGNLPYDYQNEKNLAEVHYTYDQPRLFGFEAFNDNKPNTDV